MNNLLFLFLISYSSLFAITQSECEAITKDFGGATWLEEVNECECNDLELDVSNNCSPVCDTGTFWDAEIMACVQPKKCTDLISQAQYNCKKANGHLVNLSCVDASSTQDAHLTANQCVVCKSNEVFDPNTNTCIIPSCRVGQHLLSDNITCVNDCNSSQLQNSDGTCSDFTQNTCASLEAEYKSSCNELGGTLQFECTQTNPTIEPIVSKNNCLGNAPSVHTNKLGFENHFVGNCTHYCETNDDGTILAVYARQKPQYLGASDIVCDKIEPFPKYSLISDITTSHPKFRRVTESVIYNFTDNTNFCNKIKVGFKVLTLYGADGELVQKRYVLGYSNYGYIGNGINWQKIGDYAVDYCGQGNEQICSSSLDDNIQNNDSTDTDSNSDNDDTSTNSNIDSLDSKLSSIDSKLGISNSKLSSIDSKLGISNSKLSSIDSKLGISNSKLSSIDSKLGISNDKLTESNNRLADLQYGVGVTISKLSGIESGVNATNEKLNTISSGISSINNKLSKEGDDYDPNSMDLDEISSQLNNPNSYLDNLSDNFNGAIEGVTSIKKDFDDFKSMVNGGKISSLTVSTGSCSNENIQKFGNHLAPYSPAIALFVYISFMINIFVFIFRFFALGGK